MCETTLEFRPGLLTIMLNMSETELDNYDHCPHYTKQERFIYGVSTYVEVYCVDCGESLMMARISDVR